MDDGVSDERASVHRVIARRRAPFAEEWKLTNLHRRPRRRRAGAIGNRRWIDTDRLPTGRDLDRPERENLVVDIAKVLDPPAGFRHADDGVELREAARIGRDL
jgi:hypothetical protein